MITSYLRLTKLLLMKKLLIVLLLTMTVNVVGLNTHHSVSGLVEVGLERIKVEPETNAFRELLSLKESANNPDTFNTLGYIGKYQMGRSVLKTFNVPFTVYDFMEDPSIFPESIQEELLTQLLNMNKRILRNYIDYVNNNPVYLKGHRLTEASLLAGAHLAGAGGVINWFKEGKNPKDAYGTDLESYLILFASIEGEVK